MKRLATEAEDGGIYTIVNLINGKQYVGQTYDFDMRWVQHRSDLRNNRHPNKLLQEDWNKYGRESFEFRVLEKCEDIGMFHELEIKWIKELDSIKNGYNQAIGGQGCPGWKHTEEQLERMRSKYAPKAVVQFSLEGEKIKVWPSASKAARETGIYGLGIQNCCKHLNNVRSSGGYIWLYEDEADELIGEYVANCGRNITSVEQIDLKDGSVIAVWPSISEAARTLGIHNGDISRVCQNYYGRKSAGGYGWRYANKNS